MARYRDIAADLKTRITAGEFAPAEAPITITAGEMNAGWPESLSRRRRLVARFGWVSAGVTTAIVDRDAMPAGHLRVHVEFPPHPTALNRFRPSFGFTTALPARTEAEVD